MENIAYVGLSHQIALKKQLDITANNVANMTTPGFKSQEILFNEYLAEIKDTGKKEDLSMVVNHGSFRDTSQGVLKQTGNPLDLALQGDGFFVIEMNNDDNYTRAGNFSLNSNGEIVTQNGRIVLSSENGPIVIPKNNTGITIDKNGVVSTRETLNIGKLKIVRFEDEQKLIEKGDGLYEAGTQEPLDTADTIVRQGAIEGSNVQPILEMNKMIEILRSYQKVQSLLQKDHERQRAAISKLSKVN